MNTCTWLDCSEIAEHLQLDNNEKQWANLCANHHKELNDAIESEDSKTLLRCWVRAKGGAKVIVKRMFE